MDYEELGYAHAMLVKSAGDKPTTVHSLSGELIASSTGWILLNVPNALVRGAFAALNEPGVELPPSRGTERSLNAHISVMRDDELEEKGLTPADIKERGQHFHYTLGPIQTVKPGTWDGISRVWFIKCYSPELKQLRKTYGLSPLPNNNKHDFHITIAVRRTHVLGANAIRKAASLIHGGNVNEYFNRSREYLRQRQEDRTRQRREKAAAAGRPGEPETQRGDRGDGGGDTVPSQPSPQANGAAQAVSQRPSVLETLKAIKQESDAKNYRMKHMLLRQMMRQHPEQFIVDSSDGKYHGITHAPTGFQFHVPPNVYAGLVPRKSAVIIKGNPKFISNNPKADAFYQQLRKHLEGLNYTVSDDPGEPYTEPPPANLWIGHSRGADRLRFAPKGVRTLALGSLGGVNHPNDTAMNPGDVPGDAHYELTPDMLEKISSVAEKAASLGYAVRNSSIHGKGTFATRDYEPGDRIGLALQFNREHDDGMREYDRTVLGRFVNYQSEGNAVLREENSQLYLHASKPIAEDEEIVTQPYAAELEPFQPMQINEGYKQAFDMSGSWYGSAAQDYGNNLLAGRGQIWDPSKGIWDNISQHLGNVRNMASNRIRQAENYGRFQAAVDPNYSMQQFTSYLSGQRQPLIKNPVDAFLHGRFGT